MITIRMGIFSTPVACYYFTYISFCSSSYIDAANKALKEFKPFKLPCKVSHLAGIPGASIVCIADQVSHYLVFKEECKKLWESKKPWRDGSLIFDKVKVACQLMWNFCSHKMMSLAMTSKVTMCIHCYRNLTLTSKFHAYCSSCGET